MASNINKILAGMRASGKLQDWKDKGDAGEDAVLAICLDRQRRLGGLLYQSYKYPYQSNSVNVTYCGNIKMANGKLESYESGYKGAVLNDEIDILYITPYMIFPIEVKAYHAKLVVDSKWMTKNGDRVDKSPIAQSEKHARHLYHTLWEYLPEGDSRYIKPICCFVDRCTLDDNRTPAQMAYLPACTLNRLKSELIKYNKPREYGLDLKAIQTRLNEAKVEIRKEFT